MKTRLTKSVLEQQIPIKCCAAIVSKDSSVVWTCSGTPSCSRRSMHPLLASLSETLLLLGVWLGV